MSLYEEIKVAAERTVSYEYAALSVGLLLTTVLAITFSVAVAYVHRHNLFKSVVHSVLLIALLLLPIGIGAASAQTWFYIESGRNFGTAGPTVYQLFTVAVVRNVGALHWPFALSAIYLLLHTISVSATPAPTTIGNKAIHDLVLVGVLSLTYLAVAIIDSVQKWFTYMDGYNMRAALSLTKPLTGLLYLRLALDCYAICVAAVVIVITWTRSRSRDAPEPAGLKLAVRVPSSYYSL